MTKRLILCLLTIAVLSSTGCMFFRKSSKGKKPKENAAIATQTELEFRDRWIARRVSDLAAQGVTGAAAEQQARQEFHEKFSFADKLK
ncbi:hypothetical protein [Opitutus sp. ER46]|uniref:hypothetical protein n=1 Tax=Opitutus sp. ER46 TaxID=2161864 RepID=UPI000D3196E5|nr:hypothetical protein [Opitutus sp. ER46]PTX91439.1 hypothetical protein DB354_16245 [Opitutus sp. ER46]